MQVLKALVAQGEKAINLSDQEKCLLVELTDFGKSLPEFISEIHSDNLEMSLVAKFELAIELLISLNSKGLLALYQLKPNSKVPYSLENTRTLDGPDLVEFINDPWNWSNSYSRDRNWQYELAPTVHGESVLDDIFRLKKNN
ncbi:hypothetical protein Misp06_00020 [Microbulbifer sp. NBRC 101763]|uniref:hypothetical protein n=1 Tax=Microbulbifer sp. NBRC 101763 TaxID=1113820 RepID=UPI0030A2D917